MICPCKHCISRLEHYHTTCAAYKQFRRKKEKEKEFTKGELSRLAYVAIDFRKGKKK